MTSRKIFRCLNLRQYDDDDNYYTNIFYDIAVYFLPFASMARSHS